jgi:hypothetical protein
VECSIHRLNPSLSAQYQHFLWSPSEDPRKWGHSKAFQPVEESQAGGPPDRFETFAPGPVVRRSWEHLPVYLFESRLLHDLRVALNRDEGLAELFEGVREKPPPLDSSHVRRDCAVVAADAGFYV